MRTLIFAAFALPLLAAPAMAAEGRMNTLELGRANRCLAYANLAPLQGDNVDFSALRQRFDAELAVRPKSVAHTAGQEARRIRIAAQGARTDREVATLRNRRDMECRSFTADLASKGETRTGG